MQEGSGRAKRKQLGLTLREAAAAGLIKNARGTKGNSQRRRSRAPRGGGPHTSTYAEQALRVREAAMIGGVFSALKPECRLLLLAAAELCGSLYATAAARMVPFLAQRAEVSRQLEDAAAAVADCNADNEELRQELASQTQECRETPSAPPPSRPRPLHRPRHPLAAAHGVAIAAALTVAAALVAALGATTPPRRPPLVPLAPQLLYPCRRHRRGRRWRRWRWRRWW